MKNISITQENIVKLMKKVKKTVETKDEPKRWRKYYGDVCARIFREFILQEIPFEYTISPPNAYIEGFPTEFDLLAIDKNVYPMKYTNAYPPERIRCGIEIKAHGIFGGRKDLEKVAKKIKGNFDVVKSKYPHIDFIYLTYEEVAFPKRENSINYLEETKRMINPYRVFCLKDSRTAKLIDGEWESFVSYLNHLFTKKR